jgi:hypothetical protein
MIPPEDSSRLYPRIAVETPVSVVETLTGAKRTATLADLSTGGMSFRTSSALAVGVELEVGIVPTLAITPPLYARAVVVRCVPSEGEFLVSLSTQAMGAAPSL